MPDTVTTLAHKAAIADVVNAVFDTVDAKDWKAARALFQDEVTVDFTSLAGGEPARIPAEGLIDGWITGLHPQKQSFHAVSNLRVTLHETDGDATEATADTKGYAYNRLADELGGGFWEVWGTYRFTLSLATDGSWLVDSFTFTAWHQRGDESVRTHVL